MCNNEILFSILFFNISNLLYIVLRYAEISIAKSLKIFRKKFFTEVKLKQGLKMNESGSSNGRQRHRQRERLNSNSELNRSATRISPTSIRIGPMKNREYLYVVRSTLLWFLFGFLFSTFMSSDGQTGLVLFVLLISWSLTEYLGWELLHVLGTWQY